MFSTSVKDPFADELNAGERLRWSGQSQQGLLLHPLDVFFIPFSLFWGSLAVFFEYTAFKDTTDIFSTIFGALFGVPFILTAAYFLFGRFLIDIAQRRRTFYGLTDQRAIIISGLFSRNVRSLDLRMLPEININTRRNGKGSITFGTPSPLSWFYGSGWPLLSRFSQAPAFEMIDDPRSVYQIIKEVQQQRL